MSEQAKANVPAKKKLLLIIAAVVVLLATAVIWWIASGGLVVSGKARSVIRELEKEGTTTIVLDKDITIDEPIVVKGKKTITGTGKITMYENAEIVWPELEADKSFGSGCTKVNGQETSEMPAMFIVSSGAELTFAGDIAVDAASICNVTQVLESGSLTVKGKASLANGRFCNIDVLEKGTLEVKGGSISDAAAMNISNKGTTTVKDGKVSGGSEKAVGIYSESKLVIDGGVIEKAPLHNVYVAKGELEMTDGEIVVAKADGIYVAADAKATITGGTFDTCVKHAVHNEGTTDLGKVSVKDCGIVNGKKGNLNVKGTNVRGSYVFALANEGGKITADGFSTKNCEAVAVCNLSGEMDLRNLNLEGGRDGNIHIINGKATIEDATLDKCRGKSVTISGGIVNMKNIDVQGTNGKFNGIYVFGGELYLDTAKIADVGDCGFRVDQAGYAEVKNLTIQDTVSTAVFGGRGTIVGENIVATNIGGHGVYNTGGDVTLTNFTVKGVRNVIQQRLGNTIINNIEAEDMELGCYCQEGMLTINGGSFKNSASNGLRVKEATTGDVPTLKVKDVEIKDVEFHGITNMGILFADNVTIDKAGMNGLYNKEGAKATVNGLTVKNITQYGISNAKGSNVQVSNAKVSRVGLSGKNAVHNVGTFKVNGLEISGNKEQGIYNAGIITGSKVTIHDIGKNAIYNNYDLKGTGLKASVTIDGLTMYDTGSQGINNKRGAVATLKNLVVHDVPENGVYNNNGGIMSIDGGKIYDTDKHGIQNDGTSTLSVSNFTIYDTNKDGKQFNLLNNKGKLTGSNLNLSGKAYRGVYCEAQSTTSITGLTLDATNLKDKNAISNNRATLTLKDSTIKNARVDAITAVITSTTTLDNVLIDTVGDHALNTQASTVTNATNLKIKNAKGVGVYNLGSMTTNGLTIENSANGISCRNNGVITLAGKTTITNTGKKAIQTWGDEYKSHKNKIVIPSGAAVTIDGVSDHAVLNRGTFVMDKAGSLTVKNVGGAASNAIYNYNHPDNGEVTPIMTLGKVTVQGIDVESNASVQGNAIANRGTMTLLNDIHVSDIHASGKNIDSNRNYAGITNFSGTISGDANVTVIGDAKEGVPNADTMAFGIFVEEGEVTLGDVKVVNARKRAIHIGANEKKTVEQQTVTVYKKATLNVDNLTVETSPDRGVYMDSDVCAFNATESVNVSGAGVNAIIVKGGFTAGKDVTITNTQQLEGKGGTNGFYASTNAVVSIGGNLTVDGLTAVAKDSNQGNGVVVDSTATMTVDGDVVVQNILTDNSATTSGSVAHGFFSRGETTIGGKVLINNILNGNGFLVTAKKTTVEGDVIVDNVKAKAAVQVSGKADVSFSSFTSQAPSDKTVLYISGEGTKFAVANAVNITGAFTEDVVKVEEKVQLTLNNLTVKNTSQNAVQGIVVGGAAQLTSENLSVSGGSILAQGDSTLAVTNLSVNGGGVDVQSSSALTLAGTNNITDFTGYGVSLNGTTLTLAENAVLNISNPAGKASEQAMYITGVAKVIADKATINISKVANAGIHVRGINSAFDIAIGTLNISELTGKDGNAIYLENCRNAKKKLMIGTMTATNCSQYAVKSTINITSAAQLSIGSLSVTNCGGTVDKIGTACYTMASVTP